MKNFVPNSLYNQGWKILSHVYYTINGKLLSHINYTIEDEKLYYQFIVQIGTKFFIPNSPHKQGWNFLSLKEVFKVDKYALSG